MTQISWIRRLRLRAPSTTSPPTISASRQPHRRRSHNPDHNHTNAAPRPVATPTSLGTNNSAELKRHPARWSRRARVWRMAQYTRPYQCNCGAGLSPDRFQKADVAIPRVLFADNLRLVLELRPPPDPVSVNLGSSEYLDDLIAATCHCWSARFMHWRLCDHAASTVHPPGPDSRASSGNSGCPVLE